VDAAWRDAIYAAVFVPAKRDGIPVAAASEVWLAWRLPN
jgi:hypothetical protein